MSTKHFLPDPTTLVTSALHSLTLANPSIALDAPNKIIYLRPSQSSPTQSAQHDQPPNQQSVSIISGGGSGHEPSFSSLVGPGLLSASVAGTIFASPSTSQVHTAITSRLPPTNDVLVVVMNYTGDILNFGIAVEKARALASSSSTNGARPRKVEMLVVADDVGVGRAKGGKVGRRGIAGTVLVVKIAGALARRGLGMEKVMTVARGTAENLVSVGASLSHVHVPGRGVSSTTEEKGELGAEEVEIGMGIHNEPGSGNVKLESLTVLVAEMLRQLLDQTDTDRAYLDIPQDTKVVLLVNNLGGVSVLEMGGIVDEVVRQLSETWGLKLVRILAGTYMTSLNGLGFSITLLKVVESGVEGVPGMVELLDDEAEATGWSAPVKRETWENKNTATYEDDTGLESETVGGNLTMDVDKMGPALVAGLKKVIDAEVAVTQYDTVVGDGDCGIGLKRGADAILAHLNTTPLTGDLVADLAAIGLVVEKSMDGTSGALYTIFLHSLVHSLRTISATAPGTADTMVWAKALQQSVKALGKYTPAQPGDRTLIDTLHPFVETLGRTGYVKEAAEAARKGAEGTVGMKPGLGRSVYVGGEGYKEVPDPGAWGLACFLCGVAGLSADR